MNESIGVKGGRRDRKRSLKISQNRKRKILEANEKRELNELERKVKKQQIYTLIKTLPIIIGGGTIKTIHDVATDKTKRDLEEENSKWRVKEYDADITSKTQDEFEQEQRRKIIITPSGEKIIVYVSNDFYPEKKDEPNLKEEHNDNENKQDQNDNVNRKQSKENNHDEIYDDDKNNNKIRSKGVSLENEDNNYDYDSSSNNYYIDNDFNDLPDNMRNRFQQLKSRKIIDEYEKQLKDVRYELRKVIYEYNVLVDEDDKVVLSKEAEEILERLSDIISRIEVLKSKIRIEDLDKYDDNYIYFLIEGYLSEFRDGKIVSEIKDSPLYVMISEKLNELDEKREKFDKQVSDKKEALEAKEQSFEEMKKRYYSIDRLNQDLIDFQNRQDKMLEEIRKKIDNATSESERVEYQFQGMNAMTRRMLRMLTFQMFLPGPRFARGMATSAAAHLYFLRNVIRPKTTTKRYRVITVKDYSSEIEYNIDKITEAIDLLGKTSKQIDLMIAEINDKYKDYFGVIKECDEMISNLYRMKSDLEEKEYEMEKVKKQQELELERNNAKVKTIGEYPVN